MSYSSFNSIDQIVEQLGISIKLSRSLFRHISPVTVRQEFVDMLAENVPLAFNVNTEKARSEFIIAPVLLEDNPKNKSSQIGLNLPGRGQ